jgi:cation diffusion facilitator CzcD-associated flavoprotein CzcO
VDSRYPVYQYTDPDLAKDWTWKEAFPGHEELREYIAFVVQKWDLESHITCDAEVTSASFDESQHNWEINCKDGRMFRARWLINCLGFASQPYIPQEWQNHSFNGISFHSSRWPQDGIDLTGKRVAVVGTGASAVQIIQTIVKDVEHLTVYQRTPSVCLPMRQQQLTKEYQDEFKASGEMEALQKLCKYTKHGGQNCQWSGRTWADDTPEQRLEVFEAAWRKGGFHPMLSTYFDTFTDPDANRDAWQFWARKCRERIEKPEYHDILAPLEPVHAFAGKRTPMEQDYYEAFNRSNVALVDMKTSPIEEIAPSGIRSAKEGLREYDVIVFAVSLQSST